MSNINTDNENKIILTSVSYVDTMFKKLKDWLPFIKKNNGIVQNSTSGTLKITNKNEIALGQYNTSNNNTVLSVGIGSEIERKNAFTINNNGEIFLITNLNTNSIESLQQTLDKKGVSFCYTDEEIETYKTNEYLGKLLYFNGNSDKYENALYIVSLDTQTSSIILFNIGTSIEQDLSNYYTKYEVNELIDDIQAGDIDLANYYTKKEIDDKLEVINNDITNITNWINNPIPETELDEIFNNTNINI